jgi:hypothetical protein
MTWLLGYLMLGIIVQTILMKTHPRKAAVLCALPVKYRVIVLILSVLVFPLTILMTVKEDVRLKNEAARNSRISKRT